MRTFAATINVARIIITRHIIDKFSPCVLVRLFRSRLRGKGAFEMSERTERFLDLTGVLQGVPLLDEVDET